MSESSEPSNPVQRVVEKVTGTAKEAAGTITGNEELRREGEEQEQDAMRGEAGASSGGRPGRQTEFEGEGQDHPGPARPETIEDTR